MCEYVYDIYCMCIVVFRRKLFVVQFTALEKNNVSIFTTSGLMYFRLTCHKIKLIFSKLTFLLCYLLSTILIYLNLMFILTYYTFWSRKIKTMYSPLLSLFYTIRLMRWILFWFINTHICICFIEINIYVYKSFYFNQIYWCCM